MPVHSYMVFAAFGFLLVVFLIQFFRTGESLPAILGTPTIEKLYFYSSKIALITTWVLFITKAASPRLGYIDLPVAFSWLAVGILSFGVFIMAISFINLGKSLKVGLPCQDTTLKTRGLYRFSRNPMYVGLYLTAIASCIYFPDLINIFFTLCGIYIHHLIIKQEENFLFKRFGTDWTVYRTRVSRYI